MHCIGLIALLVCCIVANDAASQQSDAALQKVFDEYHEQYLILFPLEATAFGDSRYNNLLPIDIDQDFVSVPAFHNEVLRNGGMPLEILAAKIGDWNPWKFLGLLKSPSIVQFRSTKLPCTSFLIRSRSWCSEIIVR